jgi:hypothetical protein
MSWSPRSCQAPSHDSAEHSQIGEVAFAAFVASPIVAPVRPPRRVPAVPDPDEPESRAPAAAATKARRRWPNPWLQRAEVEREGRRSALTDRHRANRHPPQVGHGAHVRDPFRDAGFTRLEMMFHPGTVAAVEALAPVLELLDAD